MSEVLVKRSDKLAFFGVLGTTSSPVYTRMTGFTDMSVAKNPKEYARQYIDEDFEQTDITGYSPAISYGFDMYNGNTVHEDIVKISDEELFGTSAVRSIIIVDCTKAGTAAGSFKAIKRDFSVIPDSEGNTSEAYTYSGSFKAKGKKILGEAVITGNTLTFTEK